MQKVLLSRTFLQERCYALCKNMHSLVNLRSYLYFKIQYWFIIRRTVLHCLPIDMLTWIFRTQSVPVQKQISSGSSWKVALEIAWELFANYLSFHCEYWKLSLTWAPNIAPELLLVPCYTSTTTNYLRVIQEHLCFRIYTHAVWQQIYSIWSVFRSQKCPSILLLFSIHSLA